MLGDALQNTTTKDITIGGIPAERLIVKSLRELSGISQRSQRLKVFLVSRTSTRTGRRLPHEPLTSKPHNMGQ